MSLTSYRAAPPRGEVRRGPVRDRPAGSTRAGLGALWNEPWGLARPGGDLLSRIYDDAVPLAAGRLTAEFGMGSGVSDGPWPPGQGRTHGGAGRRAGGVSPSDELFSKSGDAWLPASQEGVKGVRWRTPASPARRWVGSSLLDD